MSEIIKKQTAASTSPISRRKFLSSAAAASMSVPPFYCPYPIKNPITKGVDYYIDGEIRETKDTRNTIDTTTTSFKKKTFDCQLKRLQRHWDVGYEDYLLRSSTNAAKNP